ncbi:MAG: C/D box methylation guide ribonucleoprotein complex aNOP56 subunit [Candidatus Heimdallarchaeota archaeon]|nr:C/D box methylation guide ribonucleoprotein complex aNOP56 subunit [Candidatus Heimdallarchaeota archaeon]MBY8995712.1 C/D box methylation guide ribonucleoprotein complex aNOP56 subunit [Candidatus Heimdallarchaeota archaeon]
MKIHLTVTLVGPFALDDEGNIIDARNFELKPQIVSDKLAKLDVGELPKELEDLLKDHKKDQFIVQNLNLNRVLSSKGVNAVIDYDDPVIDVFHKGFIDNVQNLGLFKSRKDYIRFLRQTIILLTRERVRQAAEKRDGLIVHAIETIDDLDKTINLFSNRLREFYGMHFPELVDAIENHNTFAKVVSETGNKSNISKKLLVDEFSLPEKKAETLLASRNTSMGSPLLDQDILIIQDQATVIVELFKRRQALEKWMEEAMTAIAPNMCGVVNALLGARLISLAGSLRNLALCPSSKIQILGAEKALYRTIKTGAPPPKHGVIFQDSRLNQAKWWQRGKIARAISGRLSIAARMDFFEAEDKSETLAKEVTEKIAEVLAKYPDPPERPIRRDHRKPKPYLRKGTQNRPKSSSSSNKKR